MSNTKENLKKWLKDIVSHKRSNGNFDEGGIKAKFDSSKLALVFQPSGKEYSLEKIDDSLANEKEFDKLVDDMLS